MSSGIDASLPRVLVTGGAGFIGRHVVRQLLAAGHEVVVADLNPSQDTRTVLGDLCLPGVRDRAVSEGVDAVVHLAAQTSVLGSVQRPALVHRTNVEVTADLLELARQRGIATFVLASTNAVVGHTEETITEELPLQPLTPYGATKAAGEMLLSGYAGAFGLRTPVLRLSNVYGPGMHQKDSFVPRLFRAAAAGHGVEVYGDGRQVRDLVHVDDVARAFRLAVMQWPSGPTIIGGGRSYSVLELVAAAREACGRPIPVQHVPAKAGEMPAVVVDTARACCLGWEPSISLAEGLRTAWADFRPLDT